MDAHGRGRRGETRAAEQKQARDFKLTFIHKYTLLSTFITKEFCEGKYLHFQRIPFYFYEKHKNDGQLIFFVRPVEQI